MFCQKRSARHFDRGVVDFTATESQRLRRDVYGLFLSIIGTVVLSFRRRLFGFNAKEGWREAGFSVAYDRSAAEAGRNAVLGLARKHQQAAIYEFNTHEQQLSRAVVWCDPAKQAAQNPQPERMDALLHPPATPLGDP